MKDASSPPTQTHGLLARTLWRIETELHGPLTLRALAAREGVSPFHLSRAFSLSLGLSPMAYLKARRLSRAVQHLRESDAKIIEIALETGYDSHEGFSRAFRDYFGCAPSALRRTPDLTLDLQEARTMPSTDPIPLKTPRLETRAATSLIGQARRYSMATRGEIPQHWLDTAAEIGPAMFGVPTFGVCSDFEGESFTYMVAMEEDGPGDRDALERFTLPSGTYAVFDHEEHISMISETWEAIFQSWLPAAKLTPSDGPEFELYAADFNVDRPGGVSIWIPVTEAA